MLGIVILAIIQGIAEFLPISSSAHLIIFRDLFGIGNNISSDLSFAFDIALHFGTLLAIVVYFFKDFWNMFIKGITRGINDDEGKIMWYIVIATIPAAIAGVLFEDSIESVVRSNYVLIALALAIMGVIIYYSDKENKQTKDIKQINIKDALIIGVSQIFALIPGFSRSGTTIAMARNLKINREDSAKFSFYLSAPIVLGAAIVTLFKDDTITVIGNNLSVFIVGILISFMAGLICIEFLLKYLKKHDFGLFMWYRIALALFIIIKIFM
ncbi:MAG: undecaprenyl-diphosphatase UppP [Bacilli bacterium]|nr:undecaprenyl-diphosphatase UppP [Bacilli bacterium]